MSPAAQDSCSLALFGDRVCFLVLLRSSWRRYWRTYAFFDGTRAILSLWDETLPAEEVKRAQRSTTVAAIVVQHKQHLTRRSPNITAKGGEWVWNQTEWHTPELLLRHGEWTGAEDLGLMCYRSLGGDAQVDSTVALRSSLASTRQVILCSSCVRRSKTLSCAYRSQPDCPRL